MKTLILLRGLPGSGKTTLGGLLSSYVISADDYFDIYHEGKFIPEELAQAHSWCRSVVEDRMQVDWIRLVVANTFTQDWEMKTYLDLAKEYGYTVHTVIVENRNNTKSIHNVPETTIAKMRKRFSIKL